MRNVYIINPKAGKHDHTVQFMERIRAVHAAHGEEPEIYLTQRAGHGEELARAAAEKGDAVRIWAVGGDGTVLEVVRGAEFHKNVAVGVYPCGSGNDFVRSFGKREVMGKIKYQRDYCRYNTDSISIGYELSRRYRHNGYMTEALRAMVQNAFEVMNVEVVAISHFVGNEPSRKVIERAGFIFEGVMPCGFKRFDGEIFDNVCYSILRSEYDTGLISSVQRMR